MSSRYAMVGETVIIGAGLTGLSAAMALRGAGLPFRVLEAQDRVGGLCRTEVAGGFTFDYTGHLLHLRAGPVRDMVLSCLGDLLEEHRRQASIHVSGVFVPFPIQANFGRLPPPFPARCLQDFLAAFNRTVPEDMDFERWSRSQFGDALAELFMLPYNRKLFRYPLGEMEMSWTTWSVPRPTPDQMERAARGEDTGEYGYNATFFYPRSGGIEALPAVLAEGVRDAILTSAPVSAVDTGSMTVTTADGRVFPYRALISTVPLPRLLGMATGLPGDLASIAGKLRHSSVLGLCLGLDRPAARQEHWIYFPEERHPFYRVGFPSNFSAAAAPNGCSSLCAEVAHLPAQQPDPDALLDDVEGLLRTMGIIRPDASVLVRLALPLPYAYVFYDRFRRDRLPGVIKTLRERSIVSVGRYGAWEYSAMQDAIAQGIAAAGEVAR